MSTSMPVPTKIIIDSSKSVSFRVKEATFGDGYTQTAADGINNRIDTWSIKWGALTLAEKNTVEDTLDSVGSNGILTWTPCYETTVKKFRMTNDGYKRIKQGGTFAISCDIKQCFDLS